MHVYKVIELSLVFIWISTESLLLVFALKVGFPSLNKFCITCG